MSQATQPMEEVTNSFDYVHLSQVDPNFSLIDEDVYNLVMTSAEYKEYDKTATGGKKGNFIKFVFAVKAGHPKFAGRRVFPDALFPNNFTFKILRRISDATGVEQTGTIQNWVEKLNAIQPSLKLKVVHVPDVTRVKQSDGSYVEEPNPRTVLPNGSPATKVTIDWLFGVQPGD